MTGTIFLGGTAGNQAVQEARFAGAWQAQQVAWRKEINRWPSGLSPGGRQAKGWETAETAAAGRRVSGL